MPYSLNQETLSLTVYLNSISNRGSKLETKPAIPFVSRLSSAFLFMQFLFHMPSTLLKVVATGSDLNSQPPTVVKGPGALDLMLTG